MERKNTIRWMMLFFIGMAVAGCKKDDGRMSPAELVEHHALAGTYRAQITPAFMGTSPIASGEHTIYIQDLGNGRLRMHYEQFRAEPMPFEMAVDITMNVRQGPGHSVILEGSGGIFKAEPPNGGSIDPGDIPGGIQLPPGSEGGLFSDQASITGSYAEIEKDGQKAWRYELDITPGVPLPIQILLYTHHKIN